MSVRIDARAFADRWISDWNLKDVEAVLAHFSEGVVFTSPRAKAIVGSARIEGKSRLREYWTRAVSRIQTIRFTLDYVISDGDQMGIVYVAEIALTGIGAGPPSGDSTRSTPRSTAPTYP